MTINAQDRYNSKSVSLQARLSDIVVQATKETKK